MKKVALMQPYLFPYIGYFQLISTVDLYIVYDDVQWMKGGWINRNRILENGQPAYITLSIKKDSMKKNINEREFTENFRVEKTTMLERIKANYEGAPYFEGTIELLEDLFSYQEKNAALFIANSIRQICQYIGITTRIVMSSDIDKTPGLRSQDRVIDIIKKVGAEQYVNAIGGQELYSKNAFAQHGLQLLFVKPDLLQYKQFNNQFIPALSIIDILMFNSKEQITAMLDSYNLV